MHYPKMQGSKERTESSVKMDWEPALPSSYITQTTSIYGGGKCFLLAYTVLSRYAAQERLGTNCIFPTTVVFKISQTQKDWLKHCSFEQKTGSGFHTVFSVMTEKLTQVSLF